MRYGAWCPLLGALVCLTGCDGTEGVLLYVTNASSGPSTPSEGGAPGVPEPPPAAGTTATDGTATPNDLMDGAGPPAMLDAGPPPPVPDAGPPFTPLVAVPFPPRSTWVATASMSILENAPGDPLYNPPELAIDDDRVSRWSTGVGQAGDEWFQVDFGANVQITQIAIVGGEAQYSMYDWARSYILSLSDSDLDFNAEPFAEGTGMPGRLNITLETPAVGRYLLIQQTGMAEAWWSIHDLILAGE